MSLVESLHVLHRLRKPDQVVLSTMGAAREWMKLGTHPLDFIYAPSAMGEAPALGLGMALARPDRQVIVLNGDGCMLMNLGTLVTITAEAPANLLLVVCDNSVYEVTGGQSTAAAQRVRPAELAVDFCQIARGCGFASAHQFKRIEDWRLAAPAIVAARGPTFVLWQVEPIPGGEVPRSPAPPPDRARSFAESFQSGRSGFPA
jgi:thiamine pyrophosphate-dependent acetolactate synthase large subunit-like protein